MTFALATAATAQPTPAVVPVACVNGMKRDGRHERIVSAGGSQK